jgi:hypothetical protein
VQVQTGSVLLLCRVWCSAARVMAVVQAGAPCCRCSCACAVQQGE